MVGDSYFVIDSSYLHQCSMCVMWFTQYIYMNVACMICISLIISTYIFTWRRIRNWSQIARISMHVYSSTSIQGVTGFSYEWTCIGILEICDEFRKRTRYFLFTQHIYTNIACAFHVNVSALCCWNAIYGFELVRYFFFVWFS